MSTAVGHPENRQGRQLWKLPGTGLGWLAVALGIAAVAWGMFLPTIQDFFNERSAGLLGDGRFLVSSAVVVGGAASAAGLIAVVKRHERSILVLATVVPLLLVTLFWLVFAIGEVVAPH